MKIEICIEQLPDGGAFITMDPSAEQLIADVDAGRGTTTHGYAMVAFRALMEEARLAAAGGWNVDTGELPPSKH